MKSLATTVKDGSGSESGVRPGPRSSGRGTKAGLQPDFACRQQVPLMRRHHHDLVGAQAQELHGRQVALRVRFVVPGQFRAQDAVPGQAPIFGHIGHQGHVAVGHRGNDKPVFQPVQPRHRVGPWS